MYQHLNCTCILPLLIPFQYSTIKTRVGHADFLLKRLCVALYAHCTLISAYLWLKRIFAFVEKAHICGYAVYILIQIHNADKENICPYALIRMKPHRNQAEMEIYMRICGKSAYTGAYPHETS